MGERDAGDGTQVRPLLLTADASLLRAGALTGRRVAADGASAAACAAAGATIAKPGEGPVDTLVVDAAAAFGAGGLRGLRAALDETWATVLAVATAQWLSEADRAGGKLVLIAPRAGAGAGEQAAAAAAALENLARTLAVEWARFGVRATAIVPGPRTPEDEVGALVAYLASAGGEYFSGCRFAMR
jgi:NAD(P)-dependent dehydrogenase (short-subunit alcohol dehydrogenase family)